MSIKPKKMLQAFPGAQRFLFGAPLYERFTFDKVNAETMFRKAVKVDGHCPACGKGSTFTRVGGELDNTEWYHFENFESHFKYNQQFVVECARTASHRISFHLLFDGAVVQKVGQLPSFADIAIDQSKEFSSVLSQQDANELHKAIGLAAHGVGIGSFVYIRRIFERLIRSRFDEYKDAEGWADEDFKNLRVAEKIAFLRDHLPAFMVENKRLYGILSIGIHELDEQECLNFFEVLKASTITILEEDKQKKERETRRKELENAISAYKPPNGDE